MGRRITEVERTRMLNLRVTDAELTMAHDLANAEGLTVAGLVRQFITRSHRERFGDRAPRRRAAKGAR